MLAIYLEFGRVIEVDYFYQFTQVTEVLKRFTRIKIELKFEMSNE